MSGTTTFVFAAAAAQLARSLFLPGTDASPTRRDVGDRGDPSPHQLERHVHQGGPR